METVLKALNERLEYVREGIASDQHAIEHQHKLIANRTASMESFMRERDELLAAIAKLSP